MNLHSELKKVGVSHNCSQCCRSCCGRKEACREFYPSNIIAFLAGGAGGCVYFVRSLVKLDEKLNSLYWGDGSYD